MDRSTVRGAGLAFGIATATMGALLIAPSTASAQPVTCVQPPGGETVVLDGKTACGARSDRSSAAAALGNAGVGFAQAAASGAALGIGHAGGTGAAEATRGLVAAFALGPQSVAIGVVDQPGLSFALSGPNGRSLVGGDSGRILCEGGLSAAANIAAGQACFSNGDVSWYTP